MKMAGEWLQNAANLSVKNRKNTRKREIASKQKILMTISLRKSNISALP